MNTVGQTISEKQPGDIYFFNDAPNILIWSITFKNGNERTMQFFSYRRSVNRYLQDSMA